MPVTTIASPSSAATGCGAVADSVCARAGIDRPTLRAEIAIPPTRIRLKTGMKQSSSQELAAASEIAPSLSDISDTPTDMAMATDFEPAAAKKTSDPDENRGRVPDVAAPRLAPKSVVEGKRGGES